MSVRAQQSGFRWLVLISASLSYITLQIANLSMAPVLPQIAESLKINLGTASNLVMTTFLFSAAVALILGGGVVCDRFGVLTAIIVGCFCATAPMALMPIIGHSAAAVAWARIVEGLASAFLFPAMGAIMSLWFPERQRGLAGGLMSASVAAGSAGGVLLGPAVMAHVSSWQNMVAWLSIIGWVSLAFAVILALIPKPAVGSHEAVESGLDGAAFRRALLSPITVVGVAITFMAAWAMQCLYSLTSTFLAADKPVGAGYGAMTAGQLMIGVTLIGGLFGPVLCGILLDKVFKGNVQVVFAIGFVLMTVFVYALTLPAVIGSVPILETSLTLAGIGVQFAFSSIFYFVAKVYVPNMVGKMLGIWLGIGNFGGAIGLAVAGFTIKSQGSYHTSLIMQSLAAFVGLLLVVVLGTIRLPAAKS